MHASNIVAGSNSAHNAQMELVEKRGGGEEEEGRGERQFEAGTPQQALTEYRFLLLLHCYNEATVNSSSKLSACVIEVLKRWTVHHSRHGIRAVLSHHDTSVLSRTIASHSDIVEKVDLWSFSLDEAGLQRILPAVNTCARLAELRLGACKGSYQTPMEIGSVLSSNRKTLEVLTLNRLLVEDGIFQCAQDDTHTMERLRCLELRYV